jgi:hypothetical protein
MALCRICGFRPAWHPAARSRQPRPTTRRERAPPAVARSDLLVRREVPAGAHGLAGGRQYSISILRYTSANSSCGSPQLPDSARDDTMQSRSVAGLPRLAAGLTVSVADAIMLTVARASAAAKRRRPRARSGIRDDTFQPPHRLRARVRRSPAPRQDLDLALCCSSVDSPSTPSNEEHVGSHGTPLSADEGEDELGGAIAADLTTPWRAA